VPITAILDAR
jgi:hypothetical protein